MCSKRSHIFDMLSEKESIVFRESGNGKCSPHVVSTREMTHSGIASFTRGKDERQHEMRNCLHADDLLPFHDHGRVITVRHSHGT